MLFYKLKYIIIFFKHDIFYAIVCVYSYDVPVCSWTCTSNIEERAMNISLNKLSFTWRLQFLFMWPKFWPILNVSTRPISNWWGNWSRTGVTLTQGQTSYNRETTTWKGSSKFQIHYVHVHINLISPKYRTFSWLF